MWWRSCFPCGVAGKLALIMCIWAPACGRLHGSSDDAHGGSSSGGAATGGDAQEASLATAERAQAGQAPSQGGARSRPAQAVWALTPPHRQAPRRRALAWSTRRLSLQAPGSL